MNEFTEGHDRSPVLLRQHDPQTIRRTEMSLDKTSLRRKLEYVIPALTAVSLLVSCVVISTKKYFWNDELLSYYLLSDRSFFHMLEAFHDKINAFPPLYFLFGWLWAHVFGASELSLRLFSSLGLCTAVWLLWMTLRRTYGIWPTSIAVLAVFCTSDVILRQNAEARMYGLFLALCVLGLLLYDTACRKATYSRGLIIATVCTHVAIVNTHLFGLIYSGALLLSLILMDRRFKTLRIQLYLSIALSWLSLIPYIPSFFNQLDAGSPRTWLPAPILSDLTEFMTLSSPSLVNVFVLVLLILISGLQFILWAHKNGRAYQRGSDSEVSLMIVAYTFLAVPVFVWIVSRTLKPIFLDRYMIATAIGWSILLAHVASRILFHGPSTIEKNPRTWSQRLRAATTSVLPLALIIFLLTQPVVHAMGYRQGLSPGSFDNNFGHDDLPIVVLRSHQFLQRFFYSPARHRYFFILDWQAALNEASGLFGPQEYKNMDALARNYPKLGKHIVNGEDFLRTHHHFLVIGSLNYDRTCSCDIKGLSALAENRVTCPQWLKMRVLTNPRYQVQRLGQIGAETLLLVDSSAISKR